VLLKQTSSKIVFVFVASILLLAGAAIVWSNRAEAAYNVTFSNLWVGTITPGSGHVGVDIWWPGGSSDYNPCQHSNDAYYGACILSNTAQTSYYKVMNYTPTSSDFPYGIFVDSQNQNYCKTSSWCTNKTATSFTHGWMKLITDASIEVYPYDSNGQYNPSNNTVGGVRIQSDFPLFANGGRYSNNIGNVALPQIGQANVGKLNGFATYNGTKVAANRLLVEAFQRSATRKTSTGFPMTGFTTVSSNSDGYFNTGALPSGSYKIYITDTQTGHKVILDGVNIISQYERLDFKLEQRCFGYPNTFCTDPA